MLSEKNKARIQNCKEQLPIYIDSICESISEFAIETYEFFESLLEMFS